MKCCLSYLSYISLVVLSENNDDVRLPCLVDLHSYVEYDQLLCRHWQLNCGLFDRHWQLNGGLLGRHWQLNCGLFYHY